MPTRFDHAVIGVKSLEASLASYRRLGFDVQPGGRHADGGTENALIRFGLDYLELLAIFDQEAARVAGRTLFEEHDQREAAVIGYALATETLDEEVQRFRGNYALPAQPRAMGRKRPDGKALTWRVYAPGNSGMSFHRPWPFLIQWDTPDAQRLTIDQPGTHPNGTIGWRRIAVAVSDLETIKEIYHEQLGLKLVGEGTDASLNARYATFVIGNGRIDIQAPQGDGPLQQLLSQNGEGPYALTLVVRNLEETAAFLRQHNLAFTYEAGSEPRLQLTAEETSGVAFSLIENS